MAPKSELMTYISVAPGNERNFLFMCSTNAVFTAAHAIFDERDFPHCPKNKCNPLEIPQDVVPPPKETSRLGNNPDDIDDDNMDHDHGYPKRPAKDDDPKQEAPEAPEDELHHQQTPPCTPPPVPPPAPRTPSPARNPPPLAPPCPGRAEHRQNAQRPMVNLPNCPQRERRVPVRPGNVYGERQYPVEQLQDIKNTSRWRQTVGEASQPPRPDSPDNILGGFPDTSAMPSEDDVQKMCEEGGANLVQYLMGKALAVSDNQYENVRNWSYKDITRLPQAEQKHWRLACQEELDML